MSAAVLANSTNNHQNLLPSPSKSRKRRYDGTPISNITPKRPNGKHFGSSQPKSQFEEEVLDKLTQDINGLKNKNSEKDQQWSRPPLDDFDPTIDSLCFQQIEAEEGTLHGGKTTIKLFGATEVSLHYIESISPTNKTGRLATQYSYMLPTSYITFMSLPRFHSRGMIAKATSTTLIHN